MKIAIRDEWQRTFRFVITGAGCAALYFILTLLLLSCGIIPFAASLAAYSLSFCVAYLLQHGWTFGRETQHRRALPRYAVLQACCALGASLFTQLMERTGTGNVFTALVSTILVAALSYLVSRYWVFK